MRWLAHRSSIWFASAHALLARRTRRGGTDVVRGTRSRTYSRTRTLGCAATSSPIWCLPSNAVPYCCTLLNLLLVCCVNGHTLLPAPTLRAWASQVVPHPPTAPSLPPLRAAQ